MIQVQIVWHLNHLYVTMYTTRVYSAPGHVECVGVSKNSHFIEDLT